MAMQVGSGTKWFNLIVIACTLVGLAALGHTVFLLGHRPVSPDPAAGWVVPLANRGTVYFVSAGESNAHEFLLAAWLTLVLLLFAWVGVARLRNFRSALRGRSPPEGRNHG